jgi:hypothetical protein
MFWPLTGTPIYVTYRVGGGYDNQKKFDTIDEAKAWCEAHYREWYNSLPVPPPKNDAVRVLRSQLKVGDVWSFAFFGHGKYPIFCIRIEEHWHRETCAPGQFVWVHNKAEPPQ